MYCLAKGSTEGVKPRICMRGVWKIRPRPPRTMPRTREPKRAVEISCSAFFMFFFPNSTDTLFPAPIPKRRPKAWITTITGMHTPSAALAAAPSDPT